MAHHGPEVVVLDQRDPAVAAGIVAVQQAAYRVEAELLGFDGIPPLHDDGPRVQALQLTLLGIVDAGEIVALIGYSRAESHVEIDRLAVHPRCFRRGLARQLLTAVHEREADATRFAVSTGRDNAPALSLYRSMGYAVVADVALPEGVVVTHLTRTPMRG